MAHDLDLFKSSQSIRSASMRKARVWTAWSLYACQAATSYQFHQPAYLTDAPEDTLPDDPAWFGELHIRYPLGGTLFPLQLNICVRAKCKLRSILNALSLQAFGGACGLSLEQATTFKEQLDEWFYALPDSLTPGKIMLPHHFGLQ
jgi:hypothetical protein